MDLPGEMVAPQRRELPEEDEDARLWRSVQAGNDVAFEELVTRHGARLASMASRLLNNPADVEDLVQETFLRAYETRRRYPRVYSLRTWLLRITINLLDSLTAAQREVAARELHWQQTGQQSPRLQVVYIPCGRYVWQPVITRERYEAEAKRWPRVFGAKREEALARKVDPTTAPNSIHRTRGELDLVFIRTNGDRWGTGGPQVLAPLE